MRLFREMRRKKQEIGREECLRILKEEPRGILSVLGDDGYPYGVPMTHLWSEEDGRLYFHCAKEGHKLDAIRRCDRASFCVLDGGCREEGDWALRFRSVVVFGRVRIVEEEERKRAILRRLCAKFTDDPAYAERELANFFGSVCCLELIPEHVTGKRVKES